MHKYSFVAVVQQAVLSIDSSQPQTSIRDLRNSIRSYQNDLLNLDKNTVEYNRTLQKLADTQSKLDDITGLVSAKYSNTTNILSNSIQVVSGLTSGFAAVQGAAALFGSESEDLQKVLVRVQGAIALMQGLQGLSGLARSFSSLKTSLQSARVSVAAFNTTLAANPILAVITAASLLVIGLVALVKALDNGRQSQVELNKEVEKYDRLISETNKENEFLLSVLKQQGATEEEILKLKRQNIESEIALTKAIVSRLEQTRRLSDELKTDLENYKNSLKELASSLDGVANREREISIIQSARFRTGTQELSDNIEQLRAQGVSERDLINIRQQAINQNIELAELEIARLERLDFITPKEEEYLITLKASLTEQLRLREQLAKDQRQLYLSELRDRTATAKRELAMIVSIEKEISLQTLSEYDRRVQIATDTYNKNVELFRRYGRDITSLTVIYNNEIKRINDENQANIIASEEKAQNDYLNRIRERNDQAIIETEIQLGELENTLLSAQLNLLNVSQGGDDDAVAKATEQVVAIQELIQTAQIESQIAQVDFLELYRVQLETILDSEKISAEQRIEIQKELQDTENNIRLLGIQYQQKLINQEIKAKQDQAKKEQEIIKIRIQQQNAYLTSISGIAASASSILGNETAAGKAIAIAGATIDTYRAAAAVYAAQPGGFLVKQLAYAAAVGQGLANVQKIISTNVPGATSSGSVDTTIPRVAIPNIQEIYEPEITQQTTALRSAEERIINRVILVETDVEESVNNSRVRLEEATF